MWIRYRYDTLQKGCNFCRMHNILTANENFLIKIIINYMENEQIQKTVRKTVDYRENFYSSIYI